MPGESGAGPRLPAGGALPGGNAPPGQAAIGLSSDPLGELLSDLQSPDPAIRFSVLSRIESLHWEPAQVEALQRLLTGPAPGPESAESQRTQAWRALTEADPGSRFHLQKIVARLVRGKAPPGTAAEIAALLARPPAERDELALALLLEAVPRSESPATANALRQAGWTEFGPALLPFVLQFFKKHGSSEDTAAIVPLCQHSDPRVLSAAVEALEKLAPEQLQDLIVPLLVSPVPGVRSRAVRLLYRWDAAEAIRHFEALLFSDNADDRQAALFHAFFFPFPEIESLLLRFLGIEDDPTVIAKAGLLFRSNPTVEMLWKLLEIMEASLGAKRQLVGEVLSGVIRSLSQAGLVAKTPEEILRQLQAAYRDRKVRALIGQSRLELADPEAATRRLAIQRLIELHRRGFAEALAVLHQQALAESDASNCRLLAEFIAPHEEPPAAALPPTAAPPPAAPPASPDRDLTHPAATTPIAAPAATESAPSAPPPPAATAPRPRTPPVGVTPAAPAPAPIAQYLGLPPDKRREVLRHLGSPGFTLLRPLLGPALKQADGEERQELLRLIGRLGDRELAELVQPYLQDGDAAVVAVCIEVLSSLDPDRLFPFLPKLLQHPSDEVRATAVRVFALFDKKQALALVEKMFLAAQPRQRALGIFCASQFDFPSVRDVLLKNLERERHPPNIEQIGLILADNPDPDLFVTLVRIRQASSGDHRDLVARFAETVGLAVVAAGTTPHRSLPDLTAAAEEKLQEDERRSRTEAPSYALANIKKLRADGSGERGARGGAGPGRSGSGTRTGSGTSSPDEGDNLLGFTIKAFVIGFVVSLVLLFGVLRPWETAPTPTQPPPTSSSGTGDPGGGTEAIDIPLGDFEIAGRISIVDPTGAGLMIKPPTGRLQYYVFFRGGVPAGRTFLRGDNFKAKVRARNREPERDTVMVDLVKIDD